MQSYATTHLLSARNLYRISSRHTHCRALPLWTRPQSHNKRRHSCCAASTPDQMVGRDSKHPYGILPLKAETKSTYKTTDRWATAVGLVTLAIWLYRCRSQLAPCIRQNIYKLDIPGCLTIIGSLFTAFMYCKNRLVEFWCKQQKRTSYVDIIPTLASDVAVLREDVGHLKQDVAHIKDDITDIKKLLSRPWYRTPL